MNLKTPDNIAMMQLAGTGGNLYFRGKQAAGVTMAGTNWVKIRDSANWGVSLYDNSSGTTGTVTLNETAANFAVLEIFYGTSDSNYNISTRIAYPNGKRCRLSWAGSTYMYIKDVAISGTSITNYSFTKISHANGATDNTEDGANVLYIKKVVGYR